MNQLIEELAVKVLDQMDLPRAAYKKDPHYQYCKEQLEQQKQELGQFVESTIQPGIREWLTVHLGKSRLAIVARKHLNLFDRLNGILNDIDDSTGTLECLAAENAFIEGFKAGVRFNNDLKAWATSDEPN